MGWLALFLLFELLLLGKLFKRLILFAALLGLYLWVRFGLFRWQGPSVVVREAVGLLLDGLWLFHLGFPSFVLLVVVIILILLTILRLLRLSIRLLRIFILFGGLFILASKRHILIEIMIEFHKLLLQYADVVCYLDGVPNSLRLIVVFLLLSLVVAVLVLCIIVFVDVDQAERYVPDVKVWSRQLRALILDTAPFFVGQVSISIERATSYRISIVFHLLWTK